MTGQRRGLELAGLLLDSRSCRLTNALASRGPRSLSRPLRFVCLRSIAGRRTSCAGIPSQMQSATRRGRLRSTSRLRTRPRNSKRRACDWGHPHSSALQGEQGRGLRELRPRGGRSRWRPIYRQVTPDTFIILAVGPEAQIDRPGFDAAVARAQRRLAQIDLS